MHITKSYLTNEKLSVKVNVNFNYGDREMKLSEKVSEISKIDSDIAYLKDEYEENKLWGSCPDGDVRFESMLEWLHANQHKVEHMIMVANKIEGLSK
jgi:hypothetical protein